jgi:hypothetical protein
MVLGLVCRLLYLISSALWYLVFGSCACMGSIHTSYRLCSNVVCAVAEDGTRSLRPSHASDCFVAWLGKGAKGILWHTSESSTTIFPVVCARPAAPRPAQLCSNNYHAVPCESQRRRGPIQRTEPAYTAAQRGHPTYQL